MDYIIAVDTSGSTNGCPEYYSSVSNIVAKTKKDGNIRYVISWSSTAIKCDSDDIKRLYRGTNPISFLNIIESEIDYNLVIITDGEISRSDIDQCKNANLNAKDVKIYYIGHEGSMDLSFTYCFMRNKSMTYYINDVEYTIRNININSFTEEDIFKNDFIPSIVYLIQEQYENKLKILEKLKYIKNNLITNFADKNIFLQYFNDVDACVKAAKEYRNNKVDKINELIKTIEVIKEENKFDMKNVTCLKKSRKVKLDKIEESKEEVICDILLNSCKRSSLIVLENNLCFDLEILNKVKNNIFELIESEYLNKILESFEPMIICNSIFDKLDKNNSPLSRIPMKGTFIFDFSSLDEQEIMEVIKHNMHSLSCFFGTDNKITGNIILWNIFVLYILSQYCHKTFMSSEIKKILINSIITICKKTYIFLTSKNFIQPISNEYTYVSLWYIACVSHKAFSSSDERNVLINRMLYGYPEFYFEMNKHDSELFPISNEFLAEIYIYRAWQYMVKNRLDHNLSNKVRAQYQNYEIIEDKFIFLSGECKTRFDCPLSKIPVHYVIAMYNQITLKFDIFYKNTYDLEESAIDYDIKKIKTLFYTRKKSIIGSKINIYQIILEKKKNNHSVYKKIQFFFIWFIIRQFLIQFYRKKSKERGEDCIEDNSDGDLDVIDIDPSTISDKNLDKEIIKFIEKKIGNINNLDISEMILILKNYKQFDEKSLHYFKSDFEVISIPDAETELLENHVKIDVGTLRPSKICPITNKPWRDCLKENTSDGQYMSAFKIILNCVILKIMKLDNNAHKTNKNFNTDNIIKKYNISIEDVQKINIKEIMLYMSTQQDVYPINYKEILELALKKYHL